MKSNFTIPLTKLIGIILLLYTLSNCSTLSALIPTLNPGLEVQAGINDNQVETGVGSIGTTEHSLDIADSEHITVDATTGKYHIKSTEDVTVNVYETNRWLYALFALYIIGKPTLRWFWNRKTRLHPHEHITYTHVVSEPIPNRDTDHS